MKINIEVEIEWLEDGNLDEEIQKKIIHGVVGRISNDAIKRVTGQAMEQVQDKIDALVQQTYDEFLDKGITITDRWGDPTDENVKVMDLIKKRLDASLLEKVDKSGKPTDYSPYGTRLQYMVDTRVKTAVDELTKNVVSQVDNKIAEQLNKSVRERLSNTLLEKVAVDDIINKAVKEFKK